MSLLMSASLVRFQLLIKITIISIHIDLYKYQILKIYTVPLEKVQKGVFLCHELIMN